MRLLRKLPEGLPRAEFAMGYYAEVGIGGPNDIENTRKCYTSAKLTIETRMRSINSPLKSSWQEHDTITWGELVRHIQAKRWWMSLGGRVRIVGFGMIIFIIHLGRRRLLDLASVPEGSPNSRPRPRPRPGARRQQQQQQKQYPNNQNRYTVSDRR